METINDAKDRIVFLTLGDGDFSYSLDLARYLVHQSDNSSGSTRFRLIATGIDSVAELNTKYRNTPDILKKMIALQKNQCSVEISVHHGVNALENPSKWQAHHVIFNHPHLGTEDAQKHARFLSHLFYAATHDWMLNSGVLHLTLVKGQAERWKAIQSAKKHGLELLSTHDFVPPPCNPQSYQHRRHQTGKSFAFVGSETYTFKRSRDKHVVATQVPWQYDDQQTQKAAGFACPHCSKIFKEERSVRNHIKSLHNHDTKNKRKRELFCEYCKSMGIQKCFAHEQGLEDHVRAKHTGVHTVVRPDRVVEKETDENGQDASNKILVDGNLFGACRVCGFVYRTKEDEWRHAQEFVPVESHYGSANNGSATVGQTNVEARPFQCTYCEKRFRERRAQHQHENFCSGRLPDKLLERS